jgi:DNA helicase II / ATP-dependent DNA helicase PcrA
LSENNLYQKAFLESLESLNDEQRRAVEQTEGPVLVLAGPGTGKTHILASRIGNILLQTDTQAHNILCLTYTDAGAVAMRQRLLKFIGPEAHKVHIFTYHAFCNHIIKTNSEYFRRNDLELISSLEQITTIRSIIDNLEPDHILVGGRSDYFYEQHLKDIFDKIKKEDWKIAEIKKAIRLYISDLPNREKYIYQRKTGDFKKGDLKQKDIDDEIFAMKRLDAAVALFSTYEKELQTANRYDYADMISWVIKAFQENENLLRNYQEQYLYFLVDEFQDTNGSQFHILKTLIEYWDNPNVFIVGDDDQAIYEFQGARIQSFIDFYNKYKESIEVIVLKENYRSTQTILEASGGLINVNKLRIISELSGLGIDKKLLAANEKIALLSLKPTVTAYPNHLQELTDILEKLKAAQFRGERMSDYAILYPQHKQADDFIQLLEKNAIPYTSQRPIDILQTPVIQQIIYILQYIDAEMQKPLSGDEILFKILYFKCWGIPVWTIAKLSLAIQKEEKMRWREALRSNEFLQQNEIPEVEKIIELVRFLEECIAEISEMTVPMLVERVINRSGILAQIIDSQYVTQDIQILQTFFDFVKQENVKHSSFSLEKFNETLEKMANNRIRLNLQRNIDDTDGVTLSTVHSAKGLEYKYVFLIDNSNTHWENRRANTQGQFSLPDTLTLTKEEDNIESQRRLFYVGMTRAKEGLYISYHQNSQSGKHIQRSIFIDELVESQDITYIEKTLDKQVLTQTSILLLREKKIVLPNLVENFVAKKLENFVLSASSLITFLDCPLSFYYQNILGVPAQNNEFSSYGNVLHKTLQIFFNKSLFQNKKQLLPVQELIVIFTKEMETRRYEFSARAYKNRLALGKKNLALFYENEIKKWEMTGQAEVYVANTEINGVPVKGTIDKVLPLPDGSVHIIDYKTGKFDSTKFSKSTEVNIGGGRYRKQLLFYKLLYDNWRNSTLFVSNATISYLDPDLNGIFPSKNIEFEQEEVAHFKILIKETYDKILAQDFHKGCGKATCQWCEFTRTHVLPDSVFNVLTEDLDDV